MAANTKIFADKETNNWFKACIALNVTKEGLTNFVENAMKKVHAAIGSSCGQCSIKKLMQFSKCQTCDQVKHRIESFHRFNGPSWKNTKAQGWKTDWWEIAKCYLPPQGYAGVSSVQETDFNAVINIIINCTDFQNHLSPSWLSPAPPARQCPLEKVRQIGRDVRHSATCKTTDAELQDYFKMLTRLLKDSKCLARDPIANKAVIMLTDLQNDRLPLTEFGNLVQEFKQGIELIKDAVEEEFSKKAKQTLEEGLNKIKEALKDAEQVIGKKIHQANSEITATMTQAISRIELKKGESVQTLYVTTDYCEQKIRDEAEALTESSVQLIKDETKDSIARIQDKMTETTSQIEQNKVESVQTLYDRAEYCKQNIGDKELTKSNVQLIKDITKDNIGCIQKTDADKATYDYKANAEDLRSRLVGHYRDTVSYVSLSTLDQSLDKHIHDIYITPKIHRINIEKDGRRIKQEQIFSYKDCFNKGDNFSKRIYLQGEPGSGKSAFAANLVHEWCNIHLPSTESTKEKTVFVDFDNLQNFKFLFFILLRDSRHLKDIIQMMKTQLIDKIYTEDEREKATKLCLQIIKHEICLVIQDGLDEWPGDEALPSMSGILKDNCIVLTTSRPWKLTDERIKNSQVDILLEVEGISDTQAFNERILRCLLDESKDVKESVMQFEIFLETHNMQSISSSPMLHALVLCTWVDDMAERPARSSLCELYTTMLDCLCKKATTDMCYFNTLNQPPVKQFYGTKYLNPNMAHIDAIAEAAFSFLFSNETETSIVFSDVKLSDYLIPTAKEFALKSGLLSKRKAKRVTDTTCRFIHKTVQEFLTAYHIANNADVVDKVISQYLKRHDNSYLDISYMFTLLCGLNVSVANKLSALMNELDDGCDTHYAFQACILSGYKEAVANTNIPIDLHLSNFDVDGNDVEEWSHIWALNTSRVRSLHVVPLNPVHVLICSRDALSTRCQGHRPVTLPTCTSPGPPTQDDREEESSSASCLELDMSRCHNLEQLIISCDVTILPHALEGLKKLKCLELYCEFEALDLSHNEHIESLYLCSGGTLLPLSINNYTHLKCIEIVTTYDGLDLSLFENLNWISLSNKVNVLPKQPLIHNKQNLTGIRLWNFDFFSLDNKAIYTWRLLNGADPAQCADYTPVMSSIERIDLYCAKFSSTWLRSLLGTLLTLNKRVRCELMACSLLLLYYELQIWLQGSHIETCVEDAGIKPFELIFATIYTDLNNTCTFEAGSLIQLSSLWGSLFGLNVKNHQSMLTYFSNTPRYLVPLSSQTLNSLSQLETLRMSLPEYIDLQLPPSLKHLNVCYHTLSPSDLRDLVNKINAWKQSVECILEFYCVTTKDGDIKKIQPEEYIAIQKELESMKHVEVKRFQTYDISLRSRPWIRSLRDSVVVEADHAGESIDNGWFSGLRKYTDDFLWNIRNHEIDSLHSIAIRLHINCAKGPDLT